MEYFFNLNINEVMQNIRTAEVLTLYFPYLSKTLILDFRYSIDDMPLVRLMPMVSNMEERFRSLKRLRPRFPKPEAITVVPWPKYVKTLQTVGVYDKILERLMQIGYSSVVNDFVVAYDEIVKLEEKELLAAITGEGYKTIWQRNKS